MGANREMAAEAYGGGPREPWRDRSAEPWAVRETAAEAYGDGSAEPQEEAPTEADELEALGDEIAWLAAHLHAGRGRYLELVATFDRRRGWEADGHRSCAHWLVVRTGYDLRTAREHVRVARALEELGETKRAMSRGALSFSQVRALTRVATPETERDLLALAEGCTTSTLERRVRAWRRGGRRDEAARERQLHRARRLTVVPDEEGGYVIRGRLTAEVGAVLLRAIEAAGDALYGEERAEGESQHRSAEHCPDRSAEHRRDGSAGPPSPRQALRAANRRRADAMGLLCERALAAGFGGGEAPVSGTRAERYQAFLFVDEPTLRAEGEPGRSELEDGTRVAAETVRRLCCDVATVPVNRAQDGSVLDVGRRTRTIPPALRRALEVRDRGCRFPGCGLRFTDAHHITHWSDGGATSLANTILLCRRHHRLVHEAGWTVQWWGQRACFTDPRGDYHLEAGWETPELPPEPSRALVRENRLRGADPGPLTPSARWKRERYVPDEIWFRADEAGLEAASRTGTAVEPGPP